MNSFFYDGSCSFCSGLAERLKNLCDVEDIEFISFRDLKEEDVVQYHPDLTFDLLAGEIQFIYKGVRYPGFFAVRRVSHFLKKYKYFSFVLYLPLVPFIGMAVMQILKAVRGNKLS